MQQTRLSRFLSLLGSAFGAGRQARDVPRLPPVAARTVEEPPVDPIQLLQRIWGEAYVLPGGPEGIMKLILPFGLDSSMSLGDLSAGLGGPARHIAEVFNLYITALERSPELAARGHALSVGHGFGRRVPIAAYDPETFELKPRRFDAVYFQHLTWAVTDKPRFFVQLRRSLKAGGQIAFIEPTLASRDPDRRFDPRLFRALAADPPRPWPVTDYLACLADAGLDCRVVQDESALFRTQVLSAWRDCLAGIDKTRIGRRELHALLVEADHSFTLLQGLESAEIAITRFQAFAK